MGLRPHEKRTIDVESLVKATKRLRSFSAKDQHKTMQFVGDTDGISNEESVLDKPLIVKPFQSRSPADWTAPRSLKPVKERSKEFTFEKPKLGENEKLPSARSNLQAEYLKKLLGEKEKEINMLHNQLHKANNENVKLIQELEGYRGKNYDEIYQENLTYKENLNRVCKENVILRGQLRQEANKKLQKLKEFERPRTCVNMVRSQHERIRLVQSAKPRSSIISNIN